MTRALFVTVLGLVCGVLLVFPNPTTAQPPAPKPAAKPDDELVEKVRKAIEKGVRYLEKNQSPQGNWEGIILGFFADMDGGMTGVVTLALLNCGLKPEEKSVARALDYLRTLPPKKTYVVGLQTLVFAEARQAKDLPLIQRNADWLVDHAIGLKAGRLEGWSYPGNSFADNSNTQYALLGLYAAKQSGAKIDDAVWKGIQEFYNRTQMKASNTAGFWKYHNSNFDNEPSFTMSVAGVCGLVIAAMGLDQSEQQLDEKTGVAANCGLYSENTAAARGMNWIAANFTFEQGGKSVFYNIYGLERLGRLTGQRFVGKYDWYREGCELLVRWQDPQDGAIARGKGIDSATILSTSFGLLFLSKGRTPVLVSKFAWGDFQDNGQGTFRERGPGDAEGLVNWNRKHNDCRHLVEYASKELFKGTPLAWQVYDVRRQDISTDAKLLGEVGTLLQSPVLYLNGHGRIVLTGAQEQLLQKYVEEGGFIVAEACCGDAEFAKSFRALMKKLFPTSDLRKLPPEHAVWRSFHEVSPDDFKDLEGLERGCRTVCVFSPSPLAGFWEEHRFMPEKGKPAKNRGERAFRLAGNIIAYATGLELPKPRLTRQTVIDPNAADKSAPRSYFKPAQLAIGEANPAPAAMRNLMGYLRDNARIDVVLESDPKQYEVSPSDDRKLFGFKFFYLHGKKKFTLDEFAIENLQSALQTGGLLFADASCNGYEAWKEYDKSFREMCKKLFPDSKLELIPADDPLYSAKMGGAALTSVRCRREKPDGTGPEPELRSYSPHLEGIKIDGRWAVIYSKYDLGCALEGHKASDCLGHDKESATKLAAAVVLYSLKR